MYTRIRYARRVQLLVFQSGDARFWERAQGSGMCERWKDVRAQTYFFTVSE